MVDTCRSEQGTTLPLHLSRQWVGSAHKKLVSKTVKLWEKSKGHNHTHTHTHTDTHTYTHTHTHAHNIALISKGLRTAHHEHGCAQTQAIKFHIKSMKRHAMCWPRPCSAVYCCRGYWCYRAWGGEGGSQTLHAESISQTYKVKQFHVPTLPPLCPYSEWQCFNMLLGFGAKVTTTMPDVSYLKESAREGINNAPSIHATSTWKSPLSVIIAGVGYALGSEGLMVASQ